MHLFAFSTARLRRVVRHERDLFNSLVEFPMFVHVDSFNFVLVPYNPLPGAYVSDKMEKLYDCSMSKRVFITPCVHDQLFL
jgi:hypothetical protein